MKFSLSFTVLLTFLLISFGTKAQVPQLFNYQGIARDAAGNPLSNQSLST
jgi:hypothetical protein